MADYNQPTSKPESEEAKFNLGLAMLERVNTLLYKLEEAIIQGNLNEAWRTSWSVHTEIDFALKEEETKEVEEMEAAIKDMFERANPDQVYYTTYQGKQISHFKYPKEREVVLDLLIQLDRKLRKLMHVHDMLMPSKGESSMF